MIRLGTLTSFACWYSPTYPSRARQGAQPNLRLPVMDPTGCVKTRRRMGIVMNLNVLHSYPHLTYPYDFPLSTFVIHPLFFPLFCLLSTRCRRYRSRPFVQCISRPTPLMPQPPDYAPYAPYAISLTSLFSLFVPVILSQPM